MVDTLKKVWVVFLLHILRNQYLLSLFRLSLHTLERILVQCQECIHHKKDFLHLVVYSPKFEFEFYTSVPYKYVHFSNTVSKVPLQHFMALPMDVLNSFTFSSVLLHSWSEVEMVGSVAGNIGTSDTEQINSRIHHPHSFLYVICCCQYRYSVSWVALKHWGFSHTIFSCLRDINWQICSLTSFQFWNCHWQSIKGNVNLTINCTIVTAFSWCLRWVDDNFIIKGNVSQLKATFSHTSSIQISFQLEI